MSLLQEDLYLVLRCKRCPALSHPVCVSHHVLDSPTGELAHMLESAFEQRCAHAARELASFVVFGNALVPYPSINRFDTVASPISIRKAAVERLRANMERRLAGIAAMNAAVV